VQVRPSLHGLINQVKGLRLPDLDRMFSEKVEELSRGKPLHSRLAFLSDKAGKTRVVAIVDLYTQSLLKPVHSYLFSILRRLETDGTFDQEKQRRRVQQVTASDKTVFSIDMSAATDRLPAFFQA